MADDPIYHDGMRRLQDARETRGIADRLEQVTLRTVFTDEDRAFIERCPMFSSQPLTPAGTRIVHIRVACRGSFESLMPALLRFRITTVTECIDLGEMFWSTLTLDCCSWTSRTKANSGQRHGASQSG